jgi:Cys-tRNA(Pro)/Cys-tRNA(Cys) deacylase
MLPINVLMPYAVFPQTDSTSILSRLQAVGCFCRGRTGHPNAQIRYNPSMSAIKTPAIIYLDQRSIPYHVFQHAGQVTSLEQAAAERQQAPEQVVRSIVFRLAENEFLMVLMSGPAQVPWKSLRRYLGQSRLTSASEEELLQTTGCQPGTVSPFGLLVPMRILIDQSILDQPELSLGSGQRGVAILIQPAELLKSLDSYEIVRFD